MEVPEVVDARYELNYMLRGSQQQYEGAFQEVSSEYSESHDTGETFVYSAEFKDAYTFISIGRNAIRSSDQADVRQQAESFKESIETGVMSRVGAKALRDAYVGNRYTNLSDNW